MSLRKYNFTLMLVVSSLLLVALLAGCGGSGSTLTGNPAINNTTSAAPAAAGRYIVGFAPGVSSAQMDSVRGGLAQRPDHSYHTSFDGFAGPLTGAERRALAADPRVAFIEADVQVTVDAKPPWAGGGGGGGNPAQQTPWGVDRIDAELNTGAGGAGVRVAVIDTGIDLNHPDLANVENGYNAINPHKRADDDHGHGTHVAGIIAAADNLIGVVGVAPQATVVAVKVADSNGRAWVSDMVEGIDWITAQNTDTDDSNDIRVANLSMSVGAPNIPLHNATLALKESGCTLVTSAGNSSADVDGYVPNRLDWVICVTALDANDNFAGFSNFGAKVDVIAPGVSIPSLWKDAGYRTLSGTSMSSPHVAGAAALYLDGHPTATFAEVYDALTRIPPDGFAEAGEWTGAADVDGVYENLVDAELL
jgi:subtilisin family serine protease